jgi:DNA-binding response OmpR family regulator
VVVVVTGRATEDAVSGAITAGANLVLRKPFELRELRSVVQSIRLDPTGQGLEEVARELESRLVS